MNPEIRSDLIDDRPEERLPWNKPEIQHLTVSLDTTGLTGSDIDGHGGEFAPVPISDRRVKQDVSAITDALNGILALHSTQDFEQIYPQVVVARKDGLKAVNYALLVPVLVEAIKQQQAMITDLQAQVNELH